MDKLTLAALFVFQHISAYLFCSLSAAHPYPAENPRWFENLSKRRQWAGCAGSPRHPCRSLTHHATSGFWGNPRCARGPA